MKLHFTHQPGHENRLEPIFVIRDLVDQTLEI